MSHSGSHPYVERPGMQCHLQPFACRDTQLYGFFVKGDARTIQERLVDPCLNQPTRGATNYRVLSHYVMVTFADMGRGSSLLPPDRRMGWIPELSCTFWVPTVAMWTKFGIEVPQRVAVFTPYIVVDNAWSMAAGREIYGFPKELGRIDMPAAGAVATEFSVSTTVLPQYRPSEEARELPIVQIARTGDRSGERAPGWSSVEGAATAIVEFLTRTGSIVIPGPSLLLDLVKIIVEHEVPGVFLKQFRSAVDGRRACYQAIVEAPSRVTAIHGGGLLDGTYALTTIDYASHRIVSSLGLPAATVAAELPFWISFDFEADDGVEIWSA